MTTDRRSIFMRPLTPRQTLVLHYIREHPRCSITDIETTLGIDRGGANWGLHGLVNRGLVQRDELISYVPVERIVYRYSAP